MQTQEYLEEIVKAIIKFTNNISQSLVKML